MTGFVAGSRAEDMSTMSQTSVIFKALSQLDEIFGEAPSLPMLHLAACDLLCCLIGALSGT
jgi:hypothetical protein